MVRENTAQLLIQWFIVHGAKGNIFSRCWYALPLATRRLRRTHMGRFYEIIRQVPLQERRKILLSVVLNPTWLAAVKKLCAEAKAKRVEVTLISRNCADVVKEWVRLHHDELQAAHVNVVTLIANKPLDDTRDEFVREYDGFRQVDHAGFGQLHMQDKLKFVNDKTVYLGDAEEELVRGVVKRFVRV
jgi:hypothetical protein